MLSSRRKRRKGGKREVAKPPFLARISRWIHPFHDYPSGFPRTRILESLSTPGRGCCVRRAPKWRSYRKIASSTGHVYERKPGPRGEPVSVRDFAVVYAHVSLLLLSPIEGERLVPFSSTLRSSSPSRCTRGDDVSRDRSTYVRDRCNSYVAQESTQETNLISASPSHTHNLPRPTIDKLET